MISLELEPIAFIIIDFLEFFVFKDDFIALQLNVDKALFIIYDILAAKKPSSLEKMEDKR